MSRDGSCSTFPDAPVPTRTRGPRPLPPRVRQRMLIHVDAPGHLRRGRPDLLAAPHPGDRAGALRRSPSTAFLRGTWRVTISKSSGVLTICRSSGPLRLTRSAPKRREPPAAFIAPKRHDGDRLKDPDQLLPARYRARRAPRTRRLRLPSLVEVRILKVLGVAPSISRITIPWGTTRRAWARWGSPVARRNGSPPTPPVLASGPLGGGGPQSPGGRGGLGEGESPVGASRLRIASIGCPTARARACSAAPMSRKASSIRASSMALLARPDACTGGGPDAQLLSQPSHREASGPCRSRRRRRWQRSGRPAASEGSPLHLRYQAGAGGSSSNTGWRCAMAAISSALESGPIPSKNTPTSGFQRRGRPGGSRSCRRRPPRGRSGARAAARREGQPPMRGPHVAHPLALARAETRYW